MVRQIATHEEWTALLEEHKDKAVIVDFTASWCGPCKIIGPLFEELSKDEKHSNIVFVKVDVDENEETAAACSISAMPTFHVYKAKEKVQELRGCDKPGLTNMVAAHA